MCRSIKPLFNYDPPATGDEIEAATRQFVRKISGMAEPAASNQAAFETAITEIAASVRQLLVSLQTKAPPRNRELDAERARARSAARFSRSSV